MATNGAGLPRSDDPVPSPPQRRILVVDDDVDAAEALADLLRDYGHEVGTAHDGPGAIETASDFHPEIVLLDIGLPVMNGYEVAARIRSIPELWDVYLAAITGWGSEEDRRRSREAGFHCHMVKPVDIPALERLLSSFDSIRTWQRR